MGLSCFRHKDVRLRRFSLEDRARRSALSPAAATRFHDLNRAIRATAAAPNAADFHLLLLLAALGPAAAALGAESRLAGLRSRLLAALRERGDPDDVRDFEEMAAPGARGSDACPAADVTALICGVQAMRIGLS